MPSPSIPPRCILMIAVTSLAVTGMPFLSQRPKVPSTFKRTGPCGPGEYVTDIPEVRCLPCPSNQFQNEAEHNYRQCKPCRPSVPNSREVLISKCESTHDTVFLCRGGFYRKFDAAVGESCVACSECGISDSSTPVMAAPCGIRSDTLCCRTGLKHYVNGTWICGGQRKEEHVVEDHGSERSEHIKEDAIAVSEDFRNDSFIKNDSLARSNDLIEEDNGSEETKKDAVAISGDFRNGSFIKNDSIARGYDSKAQDHGSEEREHAKSNALEISKDFTNDSFINSIARDNDSLSGGQGSERSKHTKNYTLTISEDFRNESFIRNDSIIHTDDSMAEDQGSERNEHTKNYNLKISGDLRNDSFIRNNSIIHADDLKILHSHPESNWRLGEAHLSEDERALRATGVVIVLGSLGMLGCAVFIKVFIENRQSLKIVFGCASQRKERTCPRNDNAYGTF